MQKTRRSLILELDGVGSKQKSDETKLVVVLGCAAALRSRDGDVVVVAEYMVGALEADDGPVKHVGEHEPVRTGCSWMTR